MDGKVEIPIMGGAFFFFPFFYLFFFTLKNSKIGKFVKSAWSLMWLCMVIILKRNEEFKKVNLEKAGDAA